MKLLIRNALVVLAITFPVAALADVSGMQTLSSGSNLDLDTGAIVTSGGDLAWNGTALTPQGAATGVDVASTTLASVFSGASGYNTLVAEGSTLINEYSGLIGSYLGNSPITPKVNDILVVLTNGGNYSALLVTAIGSGSITLEFHTFTGSSTTSTTSGPTISSLQNNYGNILPGLPSYGIAPASLFVIYGTGMSAPGTPVLQSSAAPGLQTTLNNTSISVTVGSVTTKPFIYYTSPTQIAAVLPSTTPAGTGTITVTYNGTASAPANIVVTPSAFGIDTLYGTGSGGIVATDNTTGSVIVPTASATPGEVLTIWGSGVGADTANNDSTYPQKSDNLQKTYNVQVYIGGVAANVVYAGRSQYPGVDQVDVTVPTEAAGLLVGCSVSVVVVASGIDSNFGTLPINPGGGVCSDPALGITGTQIGQTGSQTTVKTGSVSLYQYTSPAVVSAARPIPQAQALTTTYTADASFTSETGYSYIGGSSFYSIGSCIVSESNSSGGSTTGTSAGLDAGTPIVLTGGGLSVNLPEAGTSGPELGEYYVTLTNPLIGGTAYTFTGPGGAQVGKFTVTLTFPVPLTWTNEQSISTVTESQGQLITWSGGASGTLVFISGSSTSIDFSASASFICVAPVGNEQFTIPSYVLSALPKSTTGSLGVSNIASSVSFTATGIDSGFASAGVSSEENVTYQ